MQLDTPTILRAWKDDAFRESLPSDARNALPPRPTKMDQLTDAELEQAAGGATPAIGAGIVAAGAATSVFIAVDDVMTDS